MAVYLFASRISAAVCVRSPPSPTRPWAAAPAPDPAAPGPAPGRPVCILQPRKAKTHKQVTLALTTDAEMASTAAIEKEGVDGTATQPPPYHETLEAGAGAEPEVCTSPDGRLLSGSLDALVCLLVPTADSYPDRGFLFAFLVSSRLFVRPHDLLTRVLANCHAQQIACDKPSTATERLERLMPAMVRLLEEWTDMFPYDFRDDRMTAAVRGIAQGVGCCVPSVRDRVGALLVVLLERLAKLERFEQQLAALPADRFAADTTCLPASDATTVCASATLLAQQLTAVEQERMSYVGPEEFVLSYMRQAAHPLVDDDRRTANLESYAQWSARLARLVATEICKEVVKQKRVKLAQFWVEAAKECFNIGNFNSLAAILEGLATTPVARLKETWSRVGGDKLQALRRAMDSARDHDNYRATLKAAVWRAAAGAGGGDNIVVPYFDLLVRDLHALAQLCAEKVAGDHVNMEAGWQLAKALTEFISWQQTACPFQRCPQAANHLQTYPVLTDKALLLASFECEAATGPAEREQFAALRLV